MLTQGEKTGLLKQLNEKKALIKELRSNLNELNDQKEHWFEQKDKASKEIRKIIGDLKSSKIKRDELTVVVKKHKVSRDELNKKIKKQVSEMKVLEKEKDAIVKKHNIQGDPIQIRKQIDALEYKLETNVMSFDKEKALMKEIKDLQKSHKEADKVSSVWKKIRDHSKEIEKLKNEANVFHRQIQVQAGQSQEKHEVIIESSKIIKDLKKKEKESMDKFLGLKEKFNEANTKLKKELGEINKLYEKLQMNKEKLKVVRKEKQDKTLEQKRKEVDKKLKTGKKLTNEDILAFQSQGKD